MIGSVEAIRYSQGCKGQDVVRRTDKWFILYTKSLPTIPWVKVGKHFCCFPHPFVYSAIGGFSFLGSLDDGYIQVRLSLR